MALSRVKTWTAEELTYQDLNAEFDNIINNLKAENVDGYSISVAQMQEMTNPGGVGSESLALRISDEIERLNLSLEYLRRFSRCTATRTISFRFPRPNSSTRR